MYYQRKKLVRDPMVLRAALLGMVLQKAELQAKINYLKKTILSIGVKT